MNSQKIVAIYKVTDQKEEKTTYSDEGNGRREHDHNSKRSDHLRIVVAEWINIVIRLTPWLPIIEHLSAIVREPGRAVVRDDIDNTSEIESACNSGILDKESNEEDS